MDSRPQVDNRPHLGTGYAVPVFLALALAGCGYIGAPRPPSLNIPSAIADLTAGEYGDNILVQFTLPALTTDGLDLKRVESVEVFAGPGPAPFTTDSWAATAKRYPVPGTAAGPLTHMIPASDWIGQVIVIGVRSTGPKGRISAWSNLRLVTVGPPLAKPSLVKAANSARGVLLTWTGSGPRYRVYRTAGDGPLEALAPETDQPYFEDDMTSYGIQYRYRILAVANDSQQSEISDPASITPVDTFPPAVPAGLTASPGPSSVELAWTRNTEPDLQGYNVFRAAEGAAFVKIGELVPTPVYSDTSVESGKRYRYTLSAVDMVGNESARSEEAEAVAP
jgi:hypothetical protein